MTYADDQNRQTRFIAIGITIGVVIAGGAYWWLKHRKPPEAPPVAEAVAEEAPVAAVEAAPPPIKYPLTLAPEQPAADAAAKPVDADAIAAAELLQLFDGPLAEWLIPDQLLRRLVATTDNLARNARTEALRPLRAPISPFSVQRESIDAAVGAERITLAPANFRRYDALVALLDRTDMGRAAEGYKRLYPRLQQAWENLGYPDRYFNDRVVEVIDHLLATPEPEGPLLLEQPKVLYRFADEGLESRTAGQKLLLRMGNDHARTVKRKLAEFRTLIVSKE